MAYTLEIHSNIFALCSNDINNKLKRHNLLYSIAAVQCSRAEESWSRTKTGPGFKHYSTFRAQLPLLTDFHSAGVGAVCVFWLFSSTLKNSLAVLLLEKTKRPNSGSQFTDLCPFTNTECVQVTNMSHMRLRPVWEKPAEKVPDVYVWICAFILKCQHM